MSRPVRVTELKRQLAKSIAAIDALDNLTDESLRAQQQTTESTLETMEAMLDSSEDPNYLKRVMFKQHKLERKKQARKRRTENREKRRLQVAQRRQKLHADIDRWQKDIQEEDRKKQLQQQQKARVSSSEKSKMRDLSKLVEKLIQLRDIRRKKLEAKGHFFPEEGNEFFEKIKAWNAEHEEEEQTLEQDRSKDIPLFVHPDDHWEQEPLDTTAYGHWSQGFQEIDSLRRVRNQWDYYLDDGPNESIEAKVPPTWVPPAPPSNWIWATCLTHQPQ